MFALFFFSWHPALKIWPWIIIYPLAFSTRSRKALSNHLVVWTEAQLRSAELAGGCAPRLRETGWRAAPATCSRRKHRCSVLLCPLPKWLSGSSEGLSISLVLFKLAWIPLGIMATGDGEKLAFSGRFFGPFGRGGRMIGTPVFWTQVFREMGWAGGS